MSVTTNRPEVAVEKADLITVTIDGVEVSVPKDTLVIRAAEQIGVQILAALERGEGSEADLELLLDQCDNILGRSFCALADGAVSPISSSIGFFREEYLEHLRHGGCPFDPMTSTVFADEAVMA